MSRDLTCNETMPALDDGESITDVRRMVPSRVINQQAYTTLMTNNRENSGTTSANMTVRDVVSSRIRNRGNNNEPMFASFNSTTNQSSSVTIRTSGMGSTETANTTNLLQTLIHETNRTLPTTNRNDSSLSQSIQQAGRYTNTTTINNALSAQQHQQFQPQQQPQQPQYVVTTSIPLQKQPLPMSTGYRQQQPPPSSSTTGTDQQRFGSISIAYSTYAPSTNLRGSQPATMVVSQNNCYVTGASAGGPTAVSVRTTVNSSATQPNFTSYIIPAAISSNGPMTATAVGNGGVSNVYTTTNFLQQRSTDSPAGSKTVYLSRQQTASASPSAMLVDNGGVPATVTAQFVQQAHPPSRPLSAYPPEMTVGSVVRANNNFVISPTKSNAVAGGNGSQSVGLSRGTSPYAAVLPPRSESVLQGSISRESPNGFSNHGGSTTPNNSQIPPNSHSSPRPSILRGNSAVRRYVEKDSTPTSSATNFSVLNFSGLENATTVTAVNFYSNNNNNNPTSSSWPTNDGIGGDVMMKGGGDNNSNSQDDSPRKRLRKQQFDNSQLQDKLMMEVRADQLSAENTGLWKFGSGLVPSGSSAVQPSTIKSGYNSGGEFAGGGVGALSGREPRRRGRPRSINRPAELYHQANSARPPSQLSAATTTNVLMTTTNSAQNNSGGGMISGGYAAGVAPAASAPPKAAYALTTNSNNNSSPAVAYGTAPPSSTAGMALGANNSAPRSFMVDVDDRMLQVPLGTKRPRKYKKRTPELNPETGEPVKKPRKKGSGRKSKKELLLLEAAKRELPTTINIGAVFGAEANSASTIGELLSSAASKVSLAGGGTGGQPNLAELQQHFQQQTQQLQQAQKLHLQQQQAAQAAASNITVSSPSSLITSAKTSMYHYQQQPQQSQQQHQLSASHQQSATSTTTQPQLKAEATPPIDNHNQRQHSVEERNVIAALCKFIASTRASAESTSNVVQKAAVNGTAKSKEGTGSKSSQKSSEVAQKRTSDNFAKNLLDASKYCDLNTLWKNADRSLAASLSEDYEEISDFLSKRKHFSPSKIRGRRRNMQAPSIADAKREVFCPMFETFEEFKESLDLLKLLPTTCKYFKTSRTLLDSLRGNLYGFSAYHLAKNLISTADCAAASKTDTAKRTRAIASLRSTERRLQGTCEDLFEFLYKELKQRMEGPSLKSDGSLNSAKDLLVDLDVLNVLDRLTDSIDRLNDEAEDETAAHPQPSTSQQQPKTELLAATPAEEEKFSFANPLVAVLKPTIIPEDYRAILTSQASAEERRRMARRRSRRYYESSSESEQQLLDDEDCEAQDLPEEKKAEYVLKRLREFGDRSQRAYRNARRQSTRLLERLEPTRYREFVSMPSANGAGDADAMVVERLREDMETSFLLEVPRHESTFKPLNIYNSTRSIVMRPSREMVNAIFKGRNSHYGDNNNNAATCAKGSLPLSLSLARRVAVKSAAVEKLREAENNYIVLEELREAEQNCARISAISLARLQRKYGEKREFSRMHESIKLQCSPSTAPNNNTADIVTRLSDFERSLKRQFPQNESHEMQMKYFSDRCRETHEMAAVVVGMGHSRANTLRQCYESLAELVKDKAKNFSTVAMTVGDGLSSRASAAGVTPRAASSGGGAGGGGVDSDVEMDTTTVGKNCSGRIHLNNSSNNNAEEDGIDSAAASPAASDNNDSDRGSSDDEAAEKVGMKNLKRRLNVGVGRRRRRNNSATSSTTNCVGTGGGVEKNVGGAVAGKKRRWPGSYRRQTPPKSSTATRPMTASGDTTTLANGGASAAVRRPSAAKRGTPNSMTSSGSNR